MGQKVNPYGFRLGITTDHVSHWFTDSTKVGQRYADYVAEDIKVRRVPEEDPRPCRRRPHRARAHP